MHLIHSDSFWNSGVRSSADPLLGKTTKAGKNYLKKNQLCKVSGNVLRAYNK